MRRFNYFKPAVDWDISIGLKGGGGGAWYMFSHLLLVACKIIEGIERVGVPSTIGTRIHRSFGIDSATRLIDLVYESSQIK